MTIRKTLILLSIIGLIDSLYLSLEKITQNQALCLPGLGDCWTVNNSKYSELFGIPVAFLGAATYLILLILLLSENRSAFLKNYSTMAVFGISLFGTIFSAYLTYVEFFVIYAICPFCIVSAIVMLAIFILTSVRLLRSER
jgi:uncharacterized membrane protein